MAGGLRRLRNETGNQFEGLIGQGTDFENEVKMADLLDDLNSSKTRHHGSLMRMLTKKDSKEYQAVQKTLENIVFDTNTNFTEDVAANEKMMTRAIGYYYKLLAACEKYINKKGGSSDKGAARKAKVAEIQRYAQRDLVGIEQAFHAMKSMSAQQQSTLTWDEILHSARMEEIEVDNYSDEKLNVGADVKQGDLAGKRLKEGIFSPNLHKKLSDAQGTQINTNSLYDKAENLKLKNQETNIANRNVATSRIANLIGLGGIVEQSVNVKVKDKATGTVRTGSLMTLAKGQDTYQFIKSVNSSVMAEKDVQKREDAAKKIVSPTLQKELCSLQVLDYLCGQGDRHRGNYFSEMNGTGQLTHIHAIDNDSAFGTGVDTEKLARAQGGLLNGHSHLRVVVDSKDNLMIPHMDRQLAKNILDLKEDELRFVLKDLLETPFIDYTVQRLKKLQTAIQKEFNKADSTVFLDDDQWNDDTLNEFIEKSARRKMHSRNTELFNRRKKFLGNKFTAEELYDATSQDTYIASLIDEYIGYNNIQGFYDRNM